MNCAAAGSGAKAGTGVGVGVGIGSTVIVGVGVGECVGREAVDGRPADGCGVGGGGVAVMGDCVGRELIGVGVGAMGTGVAAMATTVGGSGVGCGCMDGSLQENSANVSAAYAISAYIGRRVIQRAIFAIRFAFILRIIPK